MDRFDQQSIGSPEDRANVVATPDIVQHHNDGRFFGLFIFFGINPAEFDGP
jgi:hypothetical protein